MSFLITVAGTDHSFSAAPGETLLDAAQKAGLEMPYSCRKGVCNTCEGRLVSGEVLVSSGSGDRVVSGNHDNLPFCKVWARSDLTIAPRRIERFDPEARKVVTASVYRIARPAPDVVILSLRFPAGIKVKFKAGQYLQVIMEGGNRRSFSMANSPAEKDGAQLHIRQVPGGRFSEAVVNGLKTGDKLQLELPFGDFFLRDDSDKPIIFVATGTGFAPIKSMTEAAIREGSTRSMTLYWGARKQQDLYQADLPTRWAEEMPNFTFVPVLSEPDPDWTGRKGLVHRAILEDHPSLLGHQVYACGNPIMTEACRHDFVTEAALPPTEIFCDAFVTGA